MPRDPLKFLEDIRLAAGAILSFVRGQSLEAYRADLLLRSAVERQFEIVGEAMVQLRKEDAGLVQRITDGRRIVAFRNLLIHRYFNIDDELVWRTATENLRRPFAKSKA